MKISMINIIVSAFVLSVTAGLFYLNRRPAENIDDVTLLRSLVGSEMCIRDRCDIAYVI